jgi:hypothetical protein
MKATKQFKIGEYVVGGIIRVNITGKVLEIKFQDYFSKEDVVTGSILTDHHDSYRQIKDFLETHGTPYYADKVIRWIESKVDLTKQGMFGW